MADSTRSARLTVFWVVGGLLGSGAISFFLACLIIYMGKSRAANTRLITLKHPTKPYEFWVDSTKPLLGPRTYGFTLSVDGVRPTQYCGRPRFVSAETKPTKAKWFDAGNAILIGFEEGQWAVLTYDAARMRLAEQSGEYHYFIAPAFKAVGDTKSPASGPGRASEFQEATTSQNDAFDETRDD